MRRVRLLPLLTAVVVGTGVIGVASMQPPPGHGWSHPIAVPEPAALSGAAGAAVAPPASAPLASAPPEPVTGTIAARVSPAWSATVATRTAIPERAVRSYAGAAMVVQTTDPGCHLGWTTLAGLGATESGHGTHGGSSVGVDGTARPGIYGPLLDGGDRAAGPLQFMPSTWSRWGVDADGDGVADPQNLDDAALAAAHYLCSYGDLADAARWRTAIFAYNHLTSYVDAVVARANAYADETR